MTVKVGPAVGPVEPEAVTGPVVARRGKVAVVRVAESVVKPTAGV